MRNILKSAVAIGLLASAGVVTAQTTDGAAVTTTDQPNDTSGVVTDPVTGTPSTPTDTTGTIASGPDTARDRVLDRAEEVHDGPVDDVDDGTETDTDTTTTTTTTTEPDRSPDTDTDVQSDAGAGDVTTTTTTTPSE